MVKTVTIPDTVECIGLYAFHDCSGLSEITLPDSVQGIAAIAFNDCNLARLIKFDIDQL